MSLTSSSVSWDGPKTGMFSGPVRIAAAISTSVAGERSGAYLPLERAPPVPTKLWHCAQLRRNSSPPSARSASDLSMGPMVGPGARLAT